MGSVWEEESWKVKESEGEVFVVQPSGASNRALEVGEGDMASGCGGSLPANYVKWTKQP